MATQTLLARALGSLRAAAAAGNSSGEAAAVVAASRRDAWHVIRLGAVAGGGVAVALTTLTALRPAAVISGLTTDPAVRAACVGIMPAVLLCQARRVGPLRVG